MFIEKAIKIHNKKYDYSLVEYVNAKTKIKIICPEHGVFEQTPDNHLQGKGCKSCAGNKIYSTDEIIKKFNNIHDNKYKYDKLDYRGIFSKIIINCAEHGFFTQTAKAHIDGKGCPKCSGRNLTNDEIKEILLKTHDNKYDYSESEFKRAKDKIKIKCNIHGEFLQVLDYHKRGSGCPKCKNSKGEKIIREFLENKKIKFESQKTFNDCKNTKTNKLLLFDFYLSDVNICIEYDGEQHFNPMRFSKHNKLKDIQFRDNIKNYFCKENKIKLIRISYKDISNIEKLLIGYLIN